MIFKNYFSSDAWFDSLQGHFMNIALTDLNERWAKPYVVKEVILFNWDAFAGGTLYAIGSCFSFASNAIVFVWNNTIGRVVNSDNPNTDQNVISNTTETKEDLKTTPPIKEDIALDTSSVLNPEVVEPSSSLPNDCDNKILGQSDCPEDAG